jgi:hypothetical protein
MTDVGIEAPLKTAQAELISDLQTLTVREVQFQDWFRGAGAFGKFTPTARMWRSGRHQEIGENIDQLITSGEAAIRLLALSSEAIPRRTRAGSREHWSWPYTFEHGKPIYHSGITAVENIDLRRGRRVLPILRLTEFSNEPKDESYVLSLPDLAHYVQAGEVELTLS